MTATRSLGADLLRICSIHNRYNASTAKHKPLPEQANSLWADVSNHCRPPSSGCPSILPQGVLHVCFEAVASPEQVCSIGRQPFCTHNQSIGISPN